MKTIIYLFYMMLLLSNIGVLQGDYSIGSLLDYLQEKELYDLIQTLKIYFGNDVAIDVCKELIQSNDCEIVVRVYMEGENGSGANKGKGRRNHNTPEICEEIFEYFEDKYNISEKIRGLIEVILTYYDSLIENMNREEIIDFIERIIRNQNINYFY